MKIRLTPGARFGLLTFVRDTDERTDDNHMRAMFRCDCGNECLSATSRVMAGKVKSCGCLAQKGVAPKHGMRKSPEYRSWQAMVGRCHSPTHKDFPRWGAKGITVCDRWRDFKTFYADMGPRPAGTSIDRIDNAKGYEPGNCRWATAKEQQRNRKKPLCVVDTPLGRMAVVDYGPLIGITPEAARRRLKRGKLVGCTLVSP